MWHNKAPNEVLNIFKTLDSEGLNYSEVQIRQEQYGLNEFKEKEKESLIKKFFKQFKNFLIIILMIAALIEIYLGEYVESIVIIAIIFLNAILSIYQEGKAEESLENLKKMSSPEAKVIRNGKKQVVASSDLVPGDIVLLEAGDIIPADLRLISSQNLKIDESSLTGESVAVEKNAECIVDEDASLGDRKNIAFMSSIVTYGRAKGVVTETGYHTEIGKIATQIDDIKQDLTPLQIQLDKLGKNLGLITMIVCAFVFALGLFQKRNPIDMLLTSVSLAVAAVPEGLPAIVTIVLSIGMDRLVKKNAIVKKLLAVETLGSTTVICSDKTGTLTQNEMTVTNIFTDGDLYTVDGTGYEPKGKILKDGNEIEDDDCRFLKAILYAAALNNDSELIEENNSYKIIGDPTEGALITLAEKAGYGHKELIHEQPRIDEIPFDSDRKMMSTFHDSDDRVIQYVKGAPDIILSHSSFILTHEGIRKINSNDIKLILDTNNSLASKALRVLGYAFKFHKNDTELDKNEDELIFIGLTGMIDPPRQEAKEAIKLCKKAGIRPVMITGDYKETAYQIARELGIASDHKESISGSELLNLSDEDYYNLVTKVSVYSRVSPEQKVKIVQALRDHDNIVAMTGDGVNDALAIKQADIGIAMGITGTDVAKSSANIILTDDNFASIVNAVSEGRIIFSNIQKFVVFLLSCNIGEILLVFTSMLMGLVEPLKPIHLLWLNLVTDSLPALALGVEKEEPGIMDKGPRSKDSPIITKKLFIGIIIQAISIAFACIMAFKVALDKYPDSITHARTIVFSTLIISELIRAFSSRSLEMPIWHIGVFSNKQMIKAVSISLIMLLIVIYVPFIQPIFDTFALKFSDWKIILSFSTIPLVTGEVWKLIKKKFVS